MKTYTVRLELELDAEDPDAAAREFFRDVHTDHDFLVEVRDAEGNFTQSYTKAEVQDEENH